MATSSSAAVAVTPALLAEYEGLMRHLMVPNTDVVRAAGAELESRLKTGTSALVLLQLIINHPQEEVIHLPIYQVLSKSIKVKKFVNNPFKQKKKHIHKTPYYAG